MEMEISMQERIARRLRESGNSEAINPHVMHLLISDTLTGLHNRLYFEERLRHELEQATPNRPLALYMIDVNDFKAFNDRYGHQVGDRALQEIASALRAAAPERAAVCRLHGDEFAVILPQVSRREADWIHAELMQEILNRNLAIGEGFPAIPLAAGVGVALAPAEAATPEALYQRADASMYREKRKGRGQVGDRVIPVDPPFVGRHDLLDTLLNRLNAAADGQGSLVMLAGPSGMGKTRLSEEVIDLAAHRGFQTVRTQIDDPTPMAAIRRTFHHLAESIGRFRMKALVREHPVVQFLSGAVRMEAPGGVLEGPTEATLAEGLALLLEAVSTDSPLLWVLDDLRMADRTTLTILEELVSSLSGMQVMVMAVARTERAAPIAADGVADWWNRIAGRSPVTRFELPPLSHAESIELVNRCLGTAEIDTAVRERPEVRSGNPLLILQFVQQVASSLSLPDGESTTLEAYYVKRFESLAQPVQELLLTAAVIGYQMEKAVLKDSSASSPETFAHNLEQLVREGWLRDEGEDVRFVHPSAQELLYFRVPMRGSVHRLVARVMEQRSDYQPAQVARHFHEGDDWVNAARHYREAAVAGEEAMAYAEAAGYYRKALHLFHAIRQMPEDWTTLSLKAAELFRLQEEFQASRQVLELGLQHCRNGRDRGAMLSRLGWLHGQDGRDDLYAELNREAVNLLRPFGPSWELALALVQQVQVEWIGGDHESARGTAREAIAVASQGVGPASAMHVIASVGTIMCKVGDLEIARECYQTALGLLKEFPRPDTLAVRTGLEFLARLAAYLNRLPEAIRLRQRVERICQKTTGVSVKNTLAMVALLVNNGDLPEARRRLEELEPMLRRVATRQVRWWWLCEYLKTCLYQHQLAGAHEHLKALERLGAGLGRDYPHFSATLIAQYQLAAGEPAPHIDWTPQALARNGKLILVATLLTGAQVLLHNGDLAGAEELLTDARRRPFLYNEAAWADWVEGHIYLAKNRVRQAIGAFRRATRAGGHAYFRALAHSEVAELYALRSEAAELTDEARTRAIHHTRAALSLFAHMGNIHHASRLKRLASLLDAERARQIKV